MADKTCNNCKANKVCDHNKYGFKNCGNYIPDTAVEVVRCNECIYNEIGSCTHSQKYDEDNYRADYFCADGTPKERGGEK